jgi:hypothetical protein
VKRNAKGTHALILEAGNGRVGPLGSGQSEQDHAGQGSSGSDEEGGDESRIQGWAGGLSAGSGTG